MRFNPFRFGGVSGRRLPTSQRALRRRRLGAEPLEERALLAIDASLAAAAGDYLPVDTNRDGYVSTIDALLVITELNRNGSRPIAPAAASASGVSAASLPAYDPLDVSRDGYLSVYDVLLVVEALDQSDLIQIRLDVTDLADNPITQISPGGSFKLTAYALDLRSSENQGVYGAWTDVTYESALAATSGTIDHEDYAGLSVSGTSTPGLLDEVGGGFTDVFVIPGPAERPLWSVQFTAGMTPGVIHFVADSADVSPAHDSLLYGVGPPVNPVSTDDISYGSDTLEVLGGPTVSINTPDPVTEGTGTDVPITFTVTLSQPSGNPITVNYTTEGITAADNVDYTHTAGQLTFNPGETSKPLPVNVIGDALNEATETFRVVLSAPTGGAGLGTAIGIGTILDNDGAVTASIAGPVNITETNASQTVDFTVTLSAASGQTITVDYATVNGTAVAGSDFTAVAGGQVTFNPGETSKPVSITILGDTINEATEAFQVQLTGSNAANLGTTLATGTILDDDPLPTLAVTNPTVTEPASGTVEMAFTISLSQASDQALTVSYQTIDGTALAGADYVQVPPTEVTFAPGQTSKPVSVTINSDADGENPETFTLHVAGVGSPALAPADGTGEILDSVTGKLMRIRLVTTDLLGNPITQVEATDPFLIEARVEDLREGEDLKGVFAAFVDILYSTSLVSATGPITFDPAFPNDHSGSVAPPGEIDEVGGAGSEAFPQNPGGEKKLFTVQVVGLAGGLATFMADPADLSPQSDVLLYNGAGPLTDDEILYLPASINILPPAELSIGPASVTEGDSGSTTLEFAVTLSKQSSKTITVDYTSVAQTATAGADFTSTSGQLTFLPGETNKMIPVTVLGDLLDESNETLLMNLSNISNAVFGTSSAVGTILDNDPLPTLLVIDGSGVEGLTDAVFTVLLSATSGRTVTVNYATLPGTASAGVDYVSQANVLTFLPGQTSKQVVVPIIYDTTDEPLETFTLQLSAPTNATLADGVGTGSISDLPLSSLSGWVYRDVNGNGSKDAGEPGLNKIRLSLSGIDLFGALVAREIESSPDGSYHFDGVLPGTYTITETQPLALLDGIESVGTLGGTAADNQIANIVVTVGSHGMEYNFGEGGLNPAFLTDDNFYASSLNGRQ